MEKFQVKLEFDGTWGEGGGIHDAEENSPTRQ